MHTYIQYIYTHTYKPDAAVIVRVGSHGGGDTAAASDENGAQIATLPQGM